MESIIIISNYFYRIHNRFFFTLGISIAAGDLCCSALFSIEIHFMTGFFPVCEIDNIRITDFPL